MLKIIKIENFDQFQCLMNRCPDNCCFENWSISIDDETYHKYVDMNIPELDMKIKPTKPHTIIKHLGKCPFIKGNGLCSIHKEYGEEFLSNTCKSYPRFVSEYGDLFIENIGLSCPAFASWLVSLNHKCKLIEQVYYENSAEINKNYVKTEAEKIMQSVIERFYEKNSVEESIVACYSMFGADETLSIISDFSEKYSLLLQNISICYLFERIMLQSKKEKPDYIAVIQRICFILEQFEKKCQELYGICLIYTEEQLSTALYQTMRIYDHEI